MAEITSITPLSNRRDMRNLIQAERYKCSPSHPMKMRIRGMTKNRINRESFIHKYQRLRKVFKNSIKTIQSKYSSPPESFAQVNRSRRIRNTIPGLTKEQDGNVKKQEALSYIDELYPQEAWIHVYTDGSATMQSGMGEQEALSTCREDNKLRILRQMESIAPITVQR